MSDALLSPGANAARAFLTARLAPRFLLGKMLLAAIVGVAFGFVVTVFALREAFPFGGVRIGPWTVWPELGAATADPYARAIVVRTGRAPLGAAEGLTFEAKTDSDGARLSALCDYEIAGAFPSGQFWSLAAFPETAPFASAGGVITSSGIVREAAGRATIALSTYARPGNWLAAPAAPFRLVLHVYETGSTGGIAGVEKTVAPAIRRTACR